MSDKGGIMKKRVFKVEIESNPLFPEINTSTIMGVFIKWGVEKAHVIEITDQEKGEV